MKSVICTYQACHTTHHVFRFWCGKENKCPNPKFGPWKFGLFIDSKFKTATSVQFNDCKNKPHQEYGPLVLIFLFISSLARYQGFRFRLILTGFGSGSHLSWQTGSGSRHLCLENCPSILWWFLIRNCCLFPFLRSFVNFLKFFFLINNF